MAERPRPQSKGGEFNSIVRDFYDDPTKLKQVRDIERGFGRYGEKINKQLSGLQAERIGRVHGAPLLSEAGNADNAYFGIMLAIPLTDETVTGHDKRVLLVVPHGNENVYATIRPLKSHNPDEAEQRLEDELYLQAFDARYTPSEDTYLHPDWRPDFGKTAYETVVRRQDELFMKIESQASERKKDMVLSTAVATARIIKNRRIATDDTSLEKLLGEDVLIELTVLSDNFDSIGREERIIWENDMRNSGLDAA